MFAFLFLPTTPSFHRFAFTFISLSLVSELSRLEELRLPGESIHGNLSALSGLSNLKKFQIYNKTKEIEGAPRDLQKQLPHCAIDVYIVSISTTIPA
jgi:hypothetical protein